MTDSARCLGWSCGDLMYNLLCNCSINWVPCCWQMARPRAYYKVRTRRPALHASPRVLLLLARSRAVPARVR